MRSAWPCRNALSPELIRLFCFARRPVEPGGDDGGEAPENEDRSGNENGRAARRKGVDQNGQSAGDKRHHGQIAIDGGHFRGLRFGFGGGLPLQQALAGDEAPDQRADDGVEGEQRLVGKKEEVEQSDKGGLARTGKRLLHASFAPAEHGAAHAEHKLNDGGKEEEKQGDDGPIDRPAGQIEPSGHEKNEGERLDERAAQVIEDLPARDGGDGTGRRGGPTRRERAKTSTARSASRREPSDVCGACRRCSGRDNRR